MNFDDSGESLEMRDMVNLGVSQRWQTRRGPKEDLRQLDWMRLDVDATWLSDDIDDKIPAKFIWNNSSIPMVLRRNNGRFGIMRKSVNADYVWRVSDTSTILSDLNYDTEGGSVQQFNVGMTRFVYPDISYYLGSRYLEPVVIEVPEDDILEKGSHSVIAAVTYVLNPRYTLMLSQEYNFDYGENVRSEAMVMRRYHRMYCALTLSVDESLDRSSITFSIWPQGVKELALGSRDYVGLVGAMTED